MSRTSKATVELEVADFFFTGGSMGCENAIISKIGRNHFSIDVGKARKTPVRNKPAYPDRDLSSLALGVTILRNAKGNDLRIDLDESADIPVYSWSSDELNWTPVKIEGIEIQLVGDRTKVLKKGKESLVFPVFQQDKIIIGAQVCFPYETMMKKIAQWKKHPAVNVDIIGQSIHKRDIPRIVITDPDSPVMKQKRWVHFFNNQHPVEGNARWRMAGMIEWILSDEPAAKDFRQRNICHFELMICPDGPVNGWIRTNADGVDMNRCYRVSGADPKIQTQEAYVVQKDIEMLMASDCPLTSLWGMHTDNGAQVRLQIVPGKEMGSILGPLSELSASVEHFDPDKLLRRPAGQADDHAKKDDYWNAGPNHQFGITNILVEGGETYSTAEKNMKTGLAIIQGIAEYYKGIKGDTF